MTELLISALDEAFIILNKSIPQTKKVTKSISILDVKPIELVSFMRDNNIPNEAYFDGKDNGYDAWNDILLSWEIDVPTSDKDKLDYCRRRFNDIAFKYIHKLLTSNGFKTIYPSSSVFNEFKTTIYDMYVNKEFDRLEKYYSNYFAKL